MNSSRVNLIARALLYEGYILYPYRASALKNQHRWTPGGLVPGGGTGSSLRTECLVIHTADETALSVRVRFLHPLMRINAVAPPAQEATEREIELRASIEKLATQRHDVSFDFPRSLEQDGNTLRQHHGVKGAIEVWAERLSVELSRVCVWVTNLTPLEATANRDEAALRTLGSAHVVLHLLGGEFVSLTDPGDEFRLHAEACRNIGVWPVLVGEPGSRDALLASPIILSDYPQIAPESPGDFFDGTEIDEMLALRVLTLTDAEKQEMAADTRTRAILERVETMSHDRLGDLHGAVRSVRAASGPQVGDRVRLRPRGRADAFDIILAGKMATVVSIEEDFEGRLYFAVTIEDDPGSDLGATGQPGHRFFFQPDEVELLPGGESP